MDAYHTAIASELHNDPLALGYAASLNISDTAICALANATTGAGAATITLPTLTHDQLATLIASVVMNLSTATTALQSKWTPMLNLISGISVFQCSSQNLSLLNALSTDFPTYLTAADITSTTTKTGSRMEVLFGAGTVLQPHDVAISQGRG